jgi:hypothetical protein
MELVVHQELAERMVQAGLAELTDQVVLQEPMVLQGLAVLTVLRVLVGQMVLQEQVVQTGQVEVMVLQVQVV